MDDNYRLAIYLQPGIGIGLYYEHTQQIAINILCFAIFISLTKDASGVFLITKKEF